VNQNNQWSEQKLAPGEASECLIGCPVFFGATWGGAKVQSSRDDCKTLDGSPASNPKSEDRINRSLAPFGVSSFGFLSDFGLRISDFAVVFGLPPLIPVKSA
jgi:hypothetical protein